MAVLRKPCLLFLVRWLADCSMCVPCAPCAPSWHVGACLCRVCSCSQHLQQAQHAKCVGGMATTRAHARRGAQLCSPSSSSSSHIGNGMCVVYVVSLATTRSRTRSMQQQQQQQSAQQEGSTCVGTASNQGTTSAHAPPTLLIRELHVQGKGGRVNSRRRGVGKRWRRSRMRRGTMASSVTSTRLCATRQRGALTDITLPALFAESPACECASCHRTFLCSARSGSSPHKVRVGEGCGVCVK